MHPFFNTLFVFAISILVSIVCLYAYVTILGLRKKNERCNKQSFSADELEQRDRNVATSAINVFHEAENDATHQRRKAISEEQSVVQQKLRASTT